MDDRELRASLRRLPEARPGEAFTAEVLARVERDERRRAAAGAAGAAVDGRAEAGPRWRPTLVAAGLAAALLAAAALWPAGGGGWWRAIGGEGEEVAANAVPEASATASEQGRAGRGEGGAWSAVDGERLDEEGRGRRAGADEPPLAVAAGGKRAEGGGSTIRGGNEAASADGSEPAPAAKAEPPSRHAGLGGGREAAESVAAAGGVSAGATPNSPQRLADTRSSLAEGVLDRSGDGGTSAEERSSVRPPSAFAQAPPTPPQAAPSPGADFFAAPPGAALPAAERLARLREERERLERRLAAFRSELPPAEPPVVLLGGEEGFDLVFDLGRWAAAPPAGTAPAAARPAVHSAGQPPRRF